MEYEELLLKEGEHGVYPPPKNQSPSPTTPALELLDVKAEPSRRAAQASHITPRSLSLLPCISKP